MPHVLEGDFCIHADINYAHTHTHIPVRNTSVITFVQQQNKYHQHCDLLREIEAMLWLPLFCFAIGLMLILVFNVLVVVSLGINGWIP